jgi:protein-S-isoprenylcysteine O-methyltransferase Ste14
MAMIQMSVAMLFFAVTHSILARLPIKGWFQSRLGDRPHHGFYRIFYSIFSVVSFLPVIYILWANPGMSIWTLDGWMSIVFRIIQIIGVIGLIVSLVQIDAGRFAGLAQVRAYASDRPLPLPSEALVTSGVYGWVRHPLYFFSLLVLWFTPAMTSTGLVFVMTSTLYFFVGSIFEERTMLAIFGESYKQYQTKVPWMLPFVK